MRKIKVESVGEKKGGGGFKKAGFRSAFKAGGEKVEVMREEGEEGEEGGVAGEGEGSGGETGEEEGYVRYDPRRPTD